MSFSLAPNISFCEIEEQRIFLDVERDRYFALGSEANDAFSRLVTGKQLASGDLERLARLESSGILAAASTGAGPAPCKSPPISSSVLDERPGRAARPLATMRAIAALARAKREIGRVPLGDLCRQFADDKKMARPARRAPQARQIAELAAAFQAAGRLIGVLDQCLAVSFALGRQALRAGLLADLAIGVRTRPFHAHAWVQIEGSLVSDRWDNVSPYTPILVL